MPINQILVHKPQQLVCATRWLSMHLYMLAYMFMHESCLLVCHPQYNTMKSWTSDPNLHLSPRRHHLLFACFLVCLPSSSLAQLVCLFACLSAFQFVCLSCCLSCLLPHAMLASLVCQFALYPLRIIYASLSFIVCLLVSCFCLCMYTHGVRTHGVRAQSPRHKQKGRGCKHMDMSQVTMFSRIRGLACPICLCTLLNPLHSSLFSLLDGLSQFYHAMYHSSLSLEYGNPCLLSCTYNLGHTLGMQAFTFLLCVLALCMMYIYIYILACPSRCDCHIPCHLRQSNT